MIKYRTIKSCEKIGKNHAIRGRPVLTIISNDYIKKIWCCRIHY